VPDQLSSDLASLRIDRETPRPPSGLRKVVVPIFVIGVLAAGGVFAYRKLEGELFKQEVKTTEVAMISPSQADVTVTATGYVIPQITSKVGSKLPGRIAKVNVKEGDTVKEGDVIAQLEDADQKSQVVAASTRVGAAQARIATARANLAEISQQVERERALVAGGAVGKANLDNLVARESALKELVRAAEAETSVAQADVGTVGVGLKDRVIIAPITGRIVTKPATVGEFVGGIGNVGLVAEIVDFTSLMVEADVPEPRLHLVKLGGPCEIILDAYPNKRFRCEASQLGQRVNRSKATIMVKVKFLPSSPEEMEGVLPEMSARVSFLSKAITDAAKDEKPKKVVANDAIAERGGGKVVFAINDGKLHAIPVKTGAAVGANAVELLDGPPQGTKVVSKPTSEMTDGQRIKETDK
jgi:RND family efflux transporter MFP subunit